VVGAVRLAATASAAETCILRRARHGSAIRHESESLNPPTRHTRGSGPGPVEAFDKRVRGGGLLGGDARQAEALQALQALRDLLVCDPPGVTHADAASGSPLARLTRAALKLVSPARTAAVPFAPAAHQPTGGRGQGVYLHGGVGRGKTMLMDMFHSTLPPPLARLTRRTHFHEFMAEVHHRLHAMRRGHADPLGAVAAAVHAESPVLCFDEVELVDVADALVLKRVLERVFALGGVLVATSNSAPEDLYEGGINRAAFLPFIHTLRDRCTVVSLDHYNDTTWEAEVGPGPGGGRAARDERTSIEGGVDYRLLADRERVVVPGQGYAASRSELPPVSISAACGEPSVLVSGSGSGYAALGRLWRAAAAAGRHRRRHRMTTTAIGEDQRIEHEGERSDVQVPVAFGRSMVVPRVRERCAWFHFDDLCGPRSNLGAADYIAIAAQFDVIAVNGVPSFSTFNENEARRFINLVDVLYERRALLIATLAAAPGALFRGEQAEDFLDDGMKKERAKVRARMEGREEEEVEESDGYAIRMAPHAVREAVVRRVRREGAWGGGEATVSGEGGSSGRSTTMVGAMEWSATGRAGASLADLQRVNFTFRASRRCASRLVEMGSAAYEAVWVDAGGEEEGQGTEN